MPENASRANSRPPPSTKNALPGTKLSDVKIVYSHPQALAQCERYLKDLGATVEAVYDTAGGAKLVAEQKLQGAAALASRRAAEVFGLDVLQEAVHAC